MLRNQGKNNTEKTVEFAERKKNGNGQATQQECQKQMDKKNRRCTYRTGKEFRRQTAKKKEGRYCTTKRTALAQRGSKQRAMAA
ncbi:hypothetical protein PoB_000980400 [Plakobranchus ocellatus]|uniref:Uncharacterized protein n=1 Tax=Plakobranchus ocellatus TaxID=259542 RepID=A0AAV3YMG9_9GAST|nr:hypothetical protein PoB_000980400 [Plakobranchus ocellatus]